MTTPMGPMGPPPEGFDPTAGGPQQFPGSPGYPPQAPAGYPPGYSPQQPGYPPQPAPKQKMSAGAIFAILVAVAFVSVLAVAILIAITRSTSLRAAERDLANERKRQLEQILQRQNATKQKDAGSVDGTDRYPLSLQEMRDSLTVLFASHQAAQQMGPNPSSPFAGLTVARMSKMVPPLTFVDGTTNSTSLGTVSIETKSPIRLVMATKGPSGTCYFEMEDAGTVSVSEVGNSLTCRAGDPPQSGWVRVAG